MSKREEIVGPPVRRRAVLGFGEFMHAERLEVVFCGGEERAAVRRCLGDSAPPGAAPRVEDENNTLRLARLHPRVAFTLDLEAGKELGISEESVGKVFVL